MAGLGGISLAVRWVEDVASPLFFTLILAWMLYSVVNTIFTFKNSKMTITRKGGEKSDNNGSEEDEEEEEEGWSQVELHEAEDDKLDEPVSDNAREALRDSNEDDIVEVPSATPPHPSGETAVLRGEPAPRPSDCVRDPLSDSLLSESSNEAVRLPGEDPVTSATTASPDSSTPVTAVPVSESSATATGAATTPDNAYERKSDDDNADSGVGDDNNYDNEDAVSDDEDWEGIEASEAEDRFSAAAALVTTMAATGNLKVGEGLQLLLYALYKQASDGPCNDKQPPVYSFKARAKWDAWKKLGSMSEEEAMAQYVGLVEQIVPPPDREGNNGAGESTKGGGGGGGGGRSVSTMLLAEGGEEMGGGDGGEEGRKPDGEGEEGGNAGGAAGDGSTSGFGRLHALASADVEDTVAVEEWIKEHPGALEQRDDEGRTALHWAADRGKLAMTQCLLALGADVNETDDEGQTALHYATVCEHESLATLLLDNGADPCRPDNEGTRPTDIRPASWSAPAWTGTG